MSTATASTPTPTTPTPAPAAEAPAAAAAAPAAAAAAAPAAGAPAAGAPAAGAAKVSPTASLYVGEISGDVTEGILFEIFNQVGPVASIRVCRDTLTRRSLGYAYVNFHSVLDAERALDALNNTPIKGRSCRIMWSQRDPSIRKSGVGNIFIKNLDTDIGHKELHDTFSAFGNILSCKVALNQKGESKGYGFVHFESAESAENAIQMVNEMMLGTKTVYVGHFRPRKDREAEKATSWTNVYVKDLSLETTDETLKAKFSEFGTVTSLAVMKGENGESKGFAFVNFEEHEAAAKAVEALNGAEIDGKAIYAGRAQKKSEREGELRKKFEQIKMERLTKYQGINLYVKNLEDDIDEERIRKEFGTFGEIKSIKIMADEKGVSRGFGFVCFSTPEEAQRAITEMNSRILQGCTKPLYVALHEPKEMRRHKLAARHAAGRKGTGRVPPGVPQMYPGPNGQPVYYPPGGAPPGGFVYPQPMMAGRGGQRGWGPQGYPQMPGNYMVPMQQRGPGPAGVPNGAARPSGPQQGAPARAPAPAPGGELSLQYLTQFPPEQQKLFIGEKLYHLIEKSQPALAGKITGMFLDSGWPIEEIFSLTTSEEKLNAKIKEAVDVLQKAGAETAAAPAEAAQ
eukprot:TRINITY_DN511_c2_g1_i1.p2 TRINITY_DN511_c2_g1~~TRINITY_DN511_c2_g1_i1.p2  ORF type:complete len:626 (+),score=216.17 TRINITY_DN511_c2_g1_i1:103-1980(+)